jgi:bifunctional non-homologous end joining protein LigD
MSLTAYRAKRKFKETPEPRGHRQGRRGALCFVVQEHQASQHHFDFRLELDGVLKSWAIPKGPSLNPQDKRLAMMVEDHPLAYRSFEGSIPEGNYGAGSVIVWDKGTYRPAETASRAESRRLLRDGLAHGHLSFILEGKKLRGEFALIKLKKGAKNAWLLLKKNDEFASTTDVTRQNTSVISGRSVNEIVAGSARRKPAGRRARSQPVPADAREVPSRTNKHAASRRDGSSPRSQHPGLTNLNKVYWPDEGYTKGDLLEYYRTVAPLLLRYLRDRPQSLHRHPNGISGKSFFQKDVSRQPPPDWVKTIAIKSESQRKDVTYIVGGEEETLLYLVNLGCIELNPWNSRIGALDNPDYLIIDLDPVDVPFDRVVETAQAVRKTLDSLDASSYCKTSGRRGLHIFVPLGARYDYDTARQFAERIANLVHRSLPESTSVARMPAQRQQRVYLDYLQNSRGQTLAAPYSIRPVPGATVSTPLKWTEVRRGLDPTRFTMKTMAKRLDKVGDLWQPVLGKGIDLLDCLERVKQGS